MAWTEAWAAIDPALSYTGALGAYTMVNIYPIAQLADDTGNVIRLTVIEDNYAIVMDDMWIGFQAGAGDVYDFDGDQVQITWNDGETSLSLGNTLGTEHVSDQITFPYDGDSSPILIAWHKQTAANAPLPRFADPSINLYYKNADDAETTDKTGYASWDATRSYFVSKIEYDTVDLSTGGGYQPYGGSPFNGSVEGFDGSKWSY